MSEAAARFRQPIDLDEFERRLRASNTTADTAKKDDPLAELARLVGQADPFRSAPPLRPAAPARTGDNPARIQKQHLQQVYPPLERPDPPFSVPEPQAPSLDFAASQAGLFDSEAHQFANETAVVPGAEAMAAAGPAKHGEYHAPDPSSEVASAAVIAASDVPRRSWRGVIILSTVLATGFAGLAAALTMKHSTSSSVATNTAASKDGLPVILAGGPTKIQPPKGAADTPDDQPSVLDKSAAAKPAKAKLVDNVERPVDLSQQPAANPPAGAKAESAPAAAADPGPLAANPPPRQVASLDPTAASPSSLAGSAPAPSPQPQAAPRTATEDVDNRPPPGPNGFPSPKRVKVVSVRPDGSIIGGDPDSAAPSAAAAPPPASEPPPQIELGVAMPNVSGPSAAPPPQDKDAAPRAVDRQTESVPPAGNDKRAKDPVAALIDPAGGGRTASTKADTGDNAAVANPEPAPKPKHGRKKKTEVADLGNQNNAAASAGDGTYAAQLAASPTESAARATLRKLQKKYGSTFTGHRLSYRRVRVDGKTVYRVRVTGLSKDDANSVCDKLQSDGGTCFVANN